MAVHVSELSFSASGGQSEGSYVTGLPLERSEPYPALIQIRLQGGLLAKGHETTITGGWG